MRTTLAALTVDGCVGRPTSEARSRERVALAAFTRVRSCRVADVSTAEASHTFDLVERRENPWRAPAEALVLSYVADRWRFGVYSAVKHSGRLFGPSRGR